MLQLWTCSNERLTCFVRCVLAEVLDEAGSEILCLLFPDACLCVGVAWIEDSGIYVGQCCGHLEVEERNLLRFSLQDAAIKDCVDDATCVGN